MQLRQIVSPAPSTGGLVFLLGAPRSGTSWLGKIFDSHPDVLYRHEPDAVIRDLGFPLQCEPEDFARYAAAANSYVRRLLDVRVSKTAGTWPVFRKRFQAVASTHARAALIGGLWALNYLPIASERSRDVSIPDLFKSNRQPLCTVIKSVSSRGRAGLLALALPASRFILITRHPCGQIASMMRGESLGKFRRRYPADQILDTSYASRYGLTRGNFDLLSRAEQLAWNWVINNEKAIDELNLTGRAKLVRYEQLCEDPLQETKALFEFVGLSWDAQTEHFIARSSSHSGLQRYYGVFRDTGQVAYKWRSELDAKDTRAILRVVSQSNLNMVLEAAGWPVSCNRDHHTTPTASIPALRPVGQALMDSEPVSLMIPPRPKPKPKPEG